VYENGCGWANLDIAANRFGSSRGERGLASNRGSSDADALDNSLENRAVVLPSLICKAEESKEDKGAEDGQPAGKLERDVVGGVHAPVNGKSLVNSGESEMCIRPTDPWADSSSDVEVDGERSEGER